jgi:hypothetical protein
LQRFDVGAYIIRALWQPTGEDALDVSVGQGHTRAF